jgi:hypothetical protein
VFTSNLRNYVFHDNRNRLRDDRISLVIALASSVLLLALGEPERVVAFVGLTILGLCMLLFTIYYCTHAPQIAAKDLRHSPRKYAVLDLPVSRRLAWLSVGTIALLAAFPLPQVEAAVVDRRLRQLAKDVPLDHSSVDRIEQLFNVVNAYGVRISERTIAMVQAALQRTSAVSPNPPDPAIKAASDGAAFASFNIGLPPGMRGPLTSTLPEAKGSQWGFTPIATNTGPDSYGTIGVVRQPDVAKMEEIDHPFPTVSEYGPGFLVVKELTVTLDGFRLKHAVFQNALITYNGGPLILEDVYFFRCRLQICASENCQRLMRALTTGGWIGFSAE